MTGYESPCIECVNLDEENVRIAEDNMRLAAKVEALKDVGVESGMRLARLRLAVEDLNDKLADKTSELARLYVEKTRAMTSPEVCAETAVLEALSDLVTPDAPGVWEAIIHQAAMTVEPNSKAGKGLRALVEAVDTYRTALWPEDFPADGLDVWPEERANALADIRYDEARDRAMDAA